MINRWELIEQLTQNLKSQDKLDFYDKERVEKCLIDYIEVYQEVYSRENDEILSEFGIKIPINKEDILKGLNRGYKAQLSVFEKLGGNIFEYPKNLEELTK